MKKVVFVILGVVAMSFSLLGMTKEKEDAYRKGAMSKVVYRAVDEQGLVVSNAIAHIRYYSYGRPQDNADWKTYSDSQGYFVAEHITNERLDVVAYKKGHYNARDSISYFDTEESEVAGGKWLPYGATKTIVLKRIVNPVEMESSPCLDYYRYPPQGEWTGFDLQKRDWVSPAGSGERPDMLVRFIRQERPNGYYKTMEVSFTNNPYAGVYQMTVDEQSDLKSVYCADTNATYSASLMFDVERNETGLRRNDFKEGQYFVFRTRTSVDDDGKLKSAHYGKIYGDWRFCERGGMAIQRIDFNPRPNDTNLEDAETARLSELNRRNDCR